MLCNITDGRPGRGEGLGKRQEKVDTGTNAEPDVEGEGIRVMDVGFDDHVGDLQVVHLKTTQYGGQSPVQ